MTSFMEFMQSAHCDESSRFERDYSLEVPYQFKGKKKLDREQSTNPLSLKLGHLWAMISSSLFVCFEADTASIWLPLALKCVCSPLHTHCLYCSEAQLRHRLINGLTDSENNPVCLS